MKHIGGLSILVFVAAMLSLPSAPRVGTVDHKVFVNHKGPGGEVHGLPRTAARGARVGATADRAF